MFRIISVPISILDTGTSFDSDAINIPDGVKILGWEFTTPNYSVARTTTSSKNNYSFYCFCWWQNNVHWFCN